MTTPQFDAEGLFGDDYLYFFAGHLEERSDAETDLIWRLLKLRPGMEVLDLACGHRRIANRLAGRACAAAGHGGSCTRCACSASPSCGTGCGRWASPRWPVTVSTGSR